MHNDELMLRHRIARPVHEAFECLCCGPAQVSCKSLSIRLAACRQSPATARSREACCKQYLMPCALNRGICLLFTAEALLRVRRYYWARSLSSLMGVRLPLDSSDVLFFTCNTSSWAH